MDTGTHKIIMNIFSGCALSEYIYLPNERKLGFLGPYDLMSDDEVFRVIENPRIQDLVESRNILGIASRDDAVAFLKVPLGRKLIELIVSKSTGKDKVNVPETLRKYYPEAFAK